MRLKEEMSCRNEDEREEFSEQKLNHQPLFFTTPTLEPGFPLQGKPVVVGYALTSKKTKSFLQPKLKDQARIKGILFVAIDQSKPLSDQGPFDVVMHKLLGKEWRQIIENARSFLHLESFLNI